MKATLKRIAAGTKSARLIGDEAPLPATGSEEKTAHMSPAITTRSAKPRNARNGRKIKFSGMTLQELRSRRDLAIIDCDFKLAFTLALEIDKLK